MSFLDGQKATVSISAVATTIQSIDVPDGDVGILIEAKVDIPTVANAVTFTFSIEDAEGDTRYSISLLPKAVKTIVLPNRIIQRGYTYSITPSGATGTAIEVDISPTYEV
jgi:hypothetical protein